MPDPDLSEIIDVDALARLLATPMFDVDACRERIARYAREGDGNAGRGIEEISRAFRAHVGDRLADHKPAMIAHLSYTNGGQYSEDVGYRIYGTFGHAIWHTHASTRVFDASPFAIANLMRALHLHADGEIDRVARDLMSWVELGDEAARDRLTPVLERAGAFELREVGHTDEVGARMLDVIALAQPRLEDKLDRILANTVAQIVRYSHLRSLAVWLETHDGPSDAPPYEPTAYGNASDRAGTRLEFEVFWRLVRRSRELFDRHIELFGSWRSITDEALRLLGIIDDDVELPHVGARGEPWRIMRAGRIVMTTSGEALTYLPRFTATACASEAAARKVFATKLEMKRAAPAPKKSKPKKSKPSKRA